MSHQCPRAVNMENKYYQMRVQFSSSGKRIVKSHYSECVSSPYRVRCHSYRETREISSNQKEQRVQDQWFQITIPYGRCYDKSWLLNAIKETCGLHFQAFQYHYINNMATFFVDNYFTARCLAHASRKIQGDDSHKITIIAAPFYLPCNRIRTLRSLNTGDSSSLVPVNNQSHINIQSCLQKRYNQSLQSLNLSNLSNDPGLRASNVFLCFSSSATKLILNIVSQCFPQIQSLDLSHNQLSKLTEFAPLFYMTPQLHSLNLSYNRLHFAEDLEDIHNLELRELWLEGNPLYEMVESPSAYYRLITYHFPNIQKVDGQFFKQELLFDQEEPKPLPPAKGSFFYREEIKTFLVNFIYQYFTWYDSGDRTSLLQLYHEHSCCSFSVPNVLYPKFHFDQIKEYWKQSRNLFKAKRPAIRQQLLRYNKLQVVGFLCNLPRTQHDLQSFTVDVSLQSNTLMCFTVEGRFKEVTLSSRSLNIPFRRTFIIIPSSETCAQILNDQMVINNSYAGYKEPEESQSSSMVLAEDPAPSSARLDTILAFCKYSGMKRDWACKCLKDNGWDVQQAQSMFTLLKSRDVIPPEAFEAGAPAVDVSG